MLPYENISLLITQIFHIVICKNTWTCDGMTHNQTDHLSTAKGRHSSMTDTQSFDVL
jgi:hypothetical protein